MCIYESTSSIEHKEKVVQDLCFLLWVLYFKVRLCTHFRPVMKEHMKYIIDHAEEIEKLIKVKAQVSEVKSIMLGNIDKVNEKKTQLLYCCKSMHFLSGALIH